MPPWDAGLWEKGGAARFTLVGKDVSSWKLKPGTFLRGKKGQTFRHEFNEQLGELARVREGSCVTWKMAWFCHGLSGPTVTPG